MSDAMSEVPGQSTSSAGDRRQDLRLRSVVDEAFAMLEPFFDPEQGWAGQSLEHLAYRVVRENFPRLSAAEVHVVVVVAHRVYIERHPDRSGHLPRPGDLRRVLL